MQLSKPSLFCYPHQNFTGITIRIKNWNSIPLKTHGFIRFSWGSCAHLFSFLCCVLKKCFCLVGFCLHSVARAMLPGSLDWSFQITPSVFSNPQCKIFYYSKNALYKNKNSSL